MSNINLERLAIVSIFVENVPETVHFYRDVLGLKLLEHHAHRPAFKLGDMTLVVAEGKPGSDKDEIHRFPVLTFSVPDIQSAYEYLIAHDVETIGRIKQVADTRWVYFEDPTGNLLELAEFGSGIHAGGD